MARKSAPPPITSNSRLPLLISLAILFVLTILRINSSHENFEPIPQQQTQTAGKKAWKPPPPFEMPPHESAEAKPASPAPPPASYLSKMPSLSGKLPALPSFNWWTSSKASTSVSQLSKLTPDSGDEWPSSIPSTLCSNSWRKDYAEYHKAVLSLGDSTLPKPAKDVWTRNPFAYRGNKPEDQRFLVYVCPKRTEDTCGGTADRLHGMVTGFILSLLTKRVFLIELGGTVKAKDIFSAPNFDWSYSYERWRRNNNLNNETMPTSLEYWMQKSPDPFVERIAKNETEDEKIIIFRGNRGYAYLMWQRPELGARMEALGFTRRTAHSCAMNYLLQPKEHLLEQMRPLLDKIRDPQYFSVGIQIRVGDEAFNPNRDKSLYTVQKHIGFFNCAEDLYKEYGHGRKLLLFLVSDSSDIRNGSMEYFAKKPEVTFLTADVVPVHVDSFDANAETVGYYGLLIDMWLLSETAYKVISFNSGVGSIAAYRTWWRNSYATVRVQNVEGQRCTDDSAFVPLKDLAQSWSLG